MRVPVLVMIAVIGLDFAKRYFPSPAIFWEGGYFLNSFEHC